MIDEQGYRANVGIILLNAKKDKVFWAKRIRQNAWQFPQGGVNEGESPVQAMYRELREEIGLFPQDVAVLGATRAWLRYRIPENRQRKSGPIVVGQKQKWFLLQLTSSDEAITLNATGHEPEFRDWRWVSYWYPLSQVIAFKKYVYRNALEYFVKEVRFKGKPKKRRPR